MGKSVANAKYVSIMMGSLPESYVAMLGSIAAATELSGNTVSSAVVVKIAIDKYDCQTLESSKTKDEAFATSPQKKGKKCDVECENCHKKGHTKDQCWAKGSSDEGGGPHWQKKDEEKSNVAATSDKLPDIKAWPVIEEIDLDGDVPHVPIVVVQGVT